MYGLFCMDSYTCPTRCSCGEGGSGFTRAVCGTEGVEDGLGFGICGLSRVCRVCCLGLGGLGGLGGCGSGGGLGGGGLGECDFGGG